MRRALDFLRENVSYAEIPVCAILVKDGEVVASAVNRKEAQNDVTSHAEILVIREASKKLNRWRLEDCELYVTLEPCPMCAWAILQSRVKTVYFGSYDTKYGAFGSAIDLRDYSDTKPKVYGGILEQECDEILKSHFAKMRS